MADREDRFLWEAQCMLMSCDKPKAYMCPDVDLTCWQKFHRFYFPNELFSAKGNIRLVSALYKLKEPQIVAEKKKREQQARASRSLENAFSDSAKQD
ncbi:Transposase [Phytophthora palmivora]|uniref:Transposase n=1 Tax=Phytophthora palmivora TaxID=4796 RepID=A0A2P4XZJ0_9STRA|nr:Transposase [Phytophthora palmivora]POM70974.1 Transposase [Phytophthora palmivora]